VVIASTSGLDDLDFPLTAVISSKTYTAVLDQCAISHSVEGRKEAPLL
jgi:hypothetical protein